ncbi:replication protein A 14 kDa subunit-like [Thrips palmi]|uniref:Replication protein A 14 kDa subunit-like n=1 Tax=Thrips palmi TaxID=161013 RepID=A0A6P8ZVH8_THRPL|nr:replication protein A 14 kDa subunit-like [Thrips palmi]
MANEKFGVPRVSVTGTMLQTNRYMEKNVRLVGYVVKNTGNSVDVNTGDNITVKLQFDAPLDEPLEGLIDVFGRVTGKDLILVEHYLTVVPEIAEDFDLPNYNKAITYLGSSDNPWTQIDF